MGGNVSFKRAVTKSRCDCKPVCALVLRALRGAGSLAATVSLVGTRGPASGGGKEGTKGTRPPQVGTGPRLAPQVWDTRVLGGRCSDPPPSPRPLSFGRPLGTATVPSTGSHAPPPLHVHFLSPRHWAAAQTTNGSDFLSCFPTRQHLQGSTTPRAESGGPPTPQTSGHPIGASMPQRRSPPCSSPRSRAGPS